MATQTPENYSVIGKRPVRHDGADKVTGKAQYGADLNLPGMLYGKVLRSPHAHARIKSIDTSKAEKHPGIRAIVTSEDFPNTNEDQMVVLGELSVNLKNLRDNILASDKVLYKGQPVVGVVADNVHIAEEALELIDIQYEKLPAVLTAPDGMKDNAPLLHEGMKTKELGEQTSKSSNVANHFQHKLLSDIFISIFGTCSSIFN